MIKNQKLIIIPARAGSTKLQNKNLKKINNTPLIYYTCVFANKLKNKNTRVIGSTDSKKILHYFNKFRISAPFLRPKKISQKYSLDIEYVNHCIDYFAKKNIFFSYGVILRPTSPIRMLKDFKKAEKKFLKNKSADSLRSICDSPVTPFKLWYIKKDRIVPILKSGFKEQYNIPRQKLTNAYWQNGAFEFFRINFKKKLKSISGKKIVYYYMNKLNSIDIDTKEDLKRFKNYLNSF